MDVGKVKRFHKVYVEEVKNFSVRSQIVNLVSSKSQNQLEDPIIGIRCEHDWNVFVTKFLRGLQNFLKIGSSCDLTS